MTTVKVPSPLTLTSAPVFGSARFREVPYRERALREGVKACDRGQIARQREAGAGGHLRSGGRLRPERHNLAGLGQVGDGAGLGHVDRIASHRQPGRDDVVECDEHGDLAVEGDPQHAVEVPIGDQEAAAVCFYRELESGRDDDLERDGRRIGQVELADVSDDSETVGPSTR